VQEVERTVRCEVRLLRREERREKEKKREGPGNHPRDCMRQAPVPPAAFGDAGARLAAGLGSEGVPGAVRTRSVRPWA